MDQDNANLSDGKSEEEDKENENKQKTPNFTVNVATDESTVKAGSDLVYTVTLENTGDVMLKNILLVHIEQSIRPIARAEILILNIVAISTYYSEGINS